MHDTQYGYDFQTGGFGGDKNVVRRTIWETSYGSLHMHMHMALGIDGSQAPKYAVLNVIPQAGGLDDPPGELLLVIAICL